MAGLIIGILIRIFSNSYLNVFQKLLTQKGEHPSIVNFYTYLGLSIIAYLACPILIFNIELLPNIIAMGFLGALGNYFIVKALSCGELSSLAPINSYKPIIALVIGVLFLQEVPGCKELIGILLIIYGTIILNNAKIFFNKATLYRIIALVLLGSEAVFIKKNIILSDISSTFFYWSLSGLLFAILFAFSTKHSKTIKKENISFQFILIILVATMQYSTNYVLEKINVAYALALFQLSTLISLFLGFSIFKEENLIKKLIASTIMLIGATVIILN